MQHQQVRREGNFYTPHEVSKILAKIVTDGVKESDSVFSVYDPTCGSGSLLLTVKDEVPGGNNSGAVKFYGQELNTTTYNLARMNLMMHGVSFKICVYQMLTRLVWIGLMDKILEE